MKYNFKMTKQAMSGQIKLMALVEKAAFDNPDLPIDFVRDLLSAKAKTKSKSTSFKPKNRSN